MNNPATEVSQVIDVSEKRPYSLDNFPATYSSRVFVAGTYRGIYKRRLLRISDAVRDAGFTPINAYEFGIPEGTDRDYCENILKQCKFAIFEVTIEAGWMSEFVLASNYRVICLSLWDRRKWTRKRISRMVLTDAQFKRNNFGYLDMREMQTAVYNFLSEYRSASL